MVDFPFGDRRFHTDKPVILLDSLKVRSARGAIQPTMTTEALESLIERVSQNDKEAFAELEAFFAENNINPERIIKDNKVKLRFWYCGKKYIVTYDPNAKPSTTSGNQGTSGTSGNQGTSGAAGGGSTEPLPGISSEEATEMVDKINGAKTQEEFDALLSELKTKVRVEQLPPAEDGSIKLRFYDKEGGKHIATYTPPVPPAGNDDVDNPPVTVSGEITRPDLSGVPEDIKSYIDSIVTLLQSSNPGDYDKAIKQLYALQETGNIYFQINVGMKSIRINWMGGGIDVSYINTPAYDATQEINDTITPKLKSGDTGAYDEAIAELEAMKTDGRIQGYAEDLNEKTVTITLNNGKTITISNCKKVEKTDETTDSENPGDVAWDNFVPWDDFETGDFETGDFGTWVEFEIYLKGTIDSYSFKEDLSKWPVTMSYETEIIEGLIEYFRENNRWASATFVDVFDKYEELYDAAHPKDEDKGDDTPPAPPRGGGGGGGTLRVDPGINLNDPYNPLTDNHQQILFQLRY